VRCGPKQIHSSLESQGLANQNGGPTRQGVGRALLILVRKISGTYRIMGIFPSSLKTPTKHKNPHHGELPPPLVAWILQLLPIRRKPNADEWLGEGSVEAIYLNRLIDDSYSIIYKKIKCYVFNGDCNDHADGAIQREAHHPMERIGGFMRSP
jgi:hypothetical protein